MKSERVLFAALLVLVLVLIAGHYWHRRRSCPSCEGFYWTDWLGGNERENFAQLHEGYDQRRRRSRFESFGAYGKVDPLGGFPDYNPHPQRHHDDDRSHFISGVAGGGPCVLQACGEGDTIAAERTEPKMIRSASIYEGFSPDEPGACSAKYNRAAQVEAEALRAAAGF